MTVEEFIQGGISSASEVDAEASEPVHDGVGVKMLAGAGSREEPGAFGVRSGSEIWSAGKVRLR